LKTLDEIAIKHGTDKSSLFHNYAVNYEHHFEAMRDQPISFLELGWGGHEDPLKGGESARAWREYFSKAKIAIIDNEEKDPSTMVKDVEFVLVSQDNAKELHKLSEGYDGWDIVVDDASHVSSLTIASFKALWEHIKPGGYYVVEDLHSSYHAHWYTLDEANPNPFMNGRKGLTAMNFFKRLADEVSYDKLEQRYWLGYPDIESITFYRDIVFVRKKQ